MTIGERIKTARRAAGITQEQLAKKIGSATITIQQYESGKRQPRVEQIKRIAEALNFDPIVLLGGSFVGYKDEMEILFPEIKTERVEIRKRALLAAFNKLNEKGKKIAAERVEELTKIPEYQQNNE